MCHHKYMDMFLVIYNECVDVFKESEDYRLLENIIKNYHK